MPRPAMTANDFRRNAAEDGDPRMLGAQDKMRYACWLIRWHDPRAQLSAPEAERYFWRAVSDDLEHWASMPDKTREYTPGDWTAFNNAQVMADRYIELAPVSDETKAAMLREYFPPAPEPDMP